MVVFCSKFILVILRIWSPYFLKSALIRAFCHSWCLPFKKYETKVNPFINFLFKSSWGSWCFILSLCLFFMFCVLRHKIYFVFRIANIEKSSKDVTNVEFKCFLICYFQGLTAANRPERPWSYQQPDSGSHLSKRGWQSKCWRTHDPYHPWLHCARQETVAWGEFRLPCGCSFLLDGLLFASVSVYS